MTVIRRMEEQDAEPVAALEKACFTVPWSREALQETLRQDYAYYFVAEEDGRIVGCCGLLHLGCDGEITNLSVAQDCRRRGIASGLLARALKEGQALGVEAFTLEVRAGNGAAIALYEKAGFTRAGERRDFYEKPRENALILWKR